LICRYVVLYTLPIGFVCSVCIVIWYRGYMPSGNGILALDKATGELAWYFFRILAVFGSIWVPAIIISAYTVATEKIWGGCVVVLLFAIQPILSVCMAMTKSDVKKYIFDLVTLSYFTEKLRTRETRTENTSGSNIGSRPHDQP